MVHVPLIILVHKSGPLAKFHQICYLCLSHFIHHTRFPLPKSRPLANFDHSRHIFFIDFIADDTPAQIIRTYLDLRKNFVF